MQDYHNGTEIQKNVDPVFKIPDDEADYEAAAKSWAHQIDKFFSPYETVKLPYFFDDLLDSVQETIKETSEAIAHLVKLAPNGLQDDSDQELLRGRQEIQEAIASMQNGPAQLEHEFTQRKIEIVK